jgi:GH24 family phage-related lysozyme (muramidase)
MLENVKARIKAHEGFNNKVYKDSLGKLTIGYGHLITIKDNFKQDIEYSTDELNNLFEQDFQIAFNQADQLLAGAQICEDAFGVIVEMIFQLGVGGVSKFKMMLNALRMHDYETAANQMLNSEWHRQTPKRCEELANILRNCKD